MRKTNNNINNIHNKSLQRRWFTCKMFTDDPTMNNGGRVFPSCHTFSTWSHSLLPRSKNLLFLLPRGDGVVENNNLDLPTWLQAPPLQGCCKILTLSWTKPGHYFNKCQSYFLAYSSECVLLAPLWFIFPWFIEPCLWQSEYPCCQIFRAHRQQSCSPAWNSFHTHSTFSYWEQCTGDTVCGFFLTVISEESLSYICVMEE